MQGFLHSSAENRQRVKSSPSPSATETMSSSAGSTSSRPATIVNASAPPRSFGFSVRNSSSTRPAASRNEFSVGPPSQSTERTPCSSRRRDISNGRSSATRTYSTFARQAGSSASEPVAITTRCSGSFEQRQVGREVEPRADHDGERVGHEPLVLPLLAHLVALDRCARSAPRATVPAPTITAST